MHANDNASFDCSKCGKRRDESLRNRDRKDCKICDGYRTHIKQVDHPSTYLDYEIYFFDRKRLSDAGLKICPMCSAEKPIDEFHKTGRCKPCRQTENINWKRAARAKKAEFAGRSFRPRHIMDAHVRQFDKFQAKMILAANDNRRWIDTASDADVAAHYAGTGKPWNNTRLSQAERYRMRYTMDAEYHVRQRMRAQFRKHFVRGCKHVLGIPTPHKRYSYKWDDVLDYTPSQFIAHMEALFTDGMDWSAFFSGRIHIDHVKPISLFNLDDPCQVRACFSLRNLQPLWAEDNLRKSNRWPGDRHCLSREAM